MFSGGDKQPINVVEPVKEKFIIANQTRIKKGDLIRVKNEHLKTTVWQLPSFDLNKTTTRKKSKLLQPDFIRASYKRIGLHTDVPVLYLGAEILPTADSFYHPKPYVAHYFLHEGKVWFKTSSPDSELETFEIEELFEPILFNNTF